MSSCVELQHDPRHCVWTGHWSSEQQQCLWDALTRFGPRDITRIAAKVPGKNVIQVAARLHCLQTATLVYERTAAVSTHEVEPVSEADECSDDDSVTHPHHRSSHNPLSQSQHNTRVQQADQNSCESSARSADDGSEDSSDESNDMSSADEAGDEPEAQPSDSDSESSSQASDASDQETSDQEDSSDQTNEVVAELSSRNVISHARLRRFLKRKAEEMNESAQRPGHAAVLLERGLRSWLSRVMPLIDAMRLKRWHSQCLSQSLPQPESQASQPLAHSVQAANESEQIDSSDSEDDERVIAKDVHAALALCIPSM